MEVSGLVSTGHVSRAEPREQECALLGDLPSGLWEHGSHWKICGIAHRLPPTIIIQHREQLHLQRLEGSLGCGVNATNFYCEFASDCFTRALGSYSVPTPWGTAVTRPRLHHPPPAQLQPLPGPRPETDSLSLGVW